MGSENDIRLEGSVAQPLLEIHHILHCYPARQEQAALTYTMSGLQPFQTILINVHFKKYYRY